MFLLDVQVNTLELGVQMQVFELGVQVKVLELGCAGINNWAKFTTELDSVKHKVDFTEVELREIEYYVMVIETKKKVHSLSCAIRVQVKMMKILELAVRVNLLSNHLQV